MPNQIDLRLTSALDRIKAAFERRFGVKATQKAIGEKFHRDQTTVSDWGRDALPDIRLGLEMAERLNITLDWLYLGRGPENADYVVASAFLTAIDQLTKDWPEEEKARTLAYLAHKAAMLRSGLPSSVDDAVNKFPELAPPPRKEH